LIIDFTTLRSAALGAKTTNGILSGKNSSNGGYHYHYHHNSIMVIISDHASVSRLSDVLQDPWFVISTNEFHVATRTKHRATISATASTSPAMMADDGETVNSCIVLVAKAAVMEAEAGGLRPMELALSPSHKQRTTIMDVRSLSLSHSVDNRSLVDTRLPLGRHYVTRS
jgi:hypothetical protein